MPRSLELYWFLSIVSPFIVLTIRTLSVCRKARQREEAWKIAERYILGSALPGAGGPPEPSRASALSVEIGVRAIAA
jgi:hypothetical protein